MRADIIRFAHAREGHVRGGCKQTSPTHIFALSLLFTRAQRYIAASTDGAIGRW